MLKRVCGPAVPLLTSALLIAGAAAGARAHTPASDSGDLDDGNLRTRVYTQISSPADSVNYTVPINLSFTNGDPHKIVLKNLDAVSGHNFDYKWWSRIEFWGGTWGITPTPVDELKSPGYDTGGWVTWFAAANGELTIEADVQLSGGQQFDNSEFDSMSAQTTLSVTSRAGNASNSAGHYHSFGLIN